MAKKTKSTATEMISQARQLMVAIEVEGTATLIQNRFDQKAIEQMLRKHMGLPNEKSKKVPAECVDRAIIRNTAGAVILSRIDVILTFFSLTFR